MTPQPQPRKMTMNNHVLIAVAAAALIAMSIPTRAASLIHHWTFDETSGSIAADSAGSINGTLVNFNNTTPDEQWVSGLMGGALDLLPSTDGSINNSVDLGSGLTAVNNTTGFSVSAWVNLTAINAIERNAFSTQVSGTAEVNLGHTDTGQASSWTGNFTSGGSIATGTWAHLVMTQSTADGKRVYLNGTQVASDVAGPNAWDSSVDAQLGAFWDGNSRYVEGKMDDISLWSGVLSATEVERINTFGRTGVAAPTAVSVPLLAYEGFDYTTGDGNASAQSGGIGWASGSTWAGVENGDPNNDDIVAGEFKPAGDSSSLVSKGNHLLQTSENRIGRALDTSTGGAFDNAGLLDGNGNIGADGTAVYISFLQQANPTDKFWEFELHRDDLGDPGRIAGLGNDADGTDLNLRTPATGASNSAGPANTGVNFYVLKIEFGAGDDDTISLFINPQLGIEGVADLVTSNAGDLSFDGISFGMYVGGMVAHDEVRIGTTYSSVTPAVPTPAALPAGLMLMMLAVGRRKW